MVDQSNLFPDPNLKVMPALISLPGSEAGISLSILPDGLPAAKCGPALAHASHSAPPAAAKEPPTPGTFGPTSASLSGSESLQRSLGNRLQARMAAYGSPEYVLTWKEWDIPSGPPICALRARARPISANDFTGWPSPTVGNAMGSQMAKGASATGRRPDGSKATVSLNHVATLAGWPTPRTPTGGAESAERKQELGRKASGGGDLESVARLTGWATPRAEDSESAGMRHARGTADTLSAQAGQDLKSHTAEMTGRVVLNPAHSRWLMGFPAAWDKASPGFEAWRSLQAAIGGYASRDTGTL